MVDESLAGLFFHTFVSGRVKQQGFIEAEVKDGYLVKYFSWFDGEPTWSEILPYGSFYGHRLYLSEEKWKDEGTRLTKENF